MTRIITGKMPKIEKKSVTQALSFGNPVEDFEAYVERKFEIPEEATKFVEVKEDWMMREFTWTWYEVEI